MENWKPLASLDDYFIRFVMETPQRPRQEVSWLWTWLDTSYQVCCAKDERLLKLSRSSALNISSRFIYFNKIQEKALKSAWGYSKCKLSSEWNEDLVQLNWNCVYTRVWERVCEMWPGPQASLICNCVWGYVDIPCSSKTCACTWFSSFSPPPKGVSALSKRKQTTEFSVKTLQITDSS